MADDGTVTRVVRLCIDTRALTDDQRELFARHAGSSRAAYNWALDALNGWWTAQNDAIHEVALVAANGDKDAAEALGRDKAWRAQVRKALPDDLRRPPSAFTLSRRFTVETRDATSRWYWWSQEKHGVSRFAVSTAITNACTAAGAWFADTGGRRTRSRQGVKPRADGMPGGWPRFQSRHRGQDSFAIFNISQATQAVDGWKVVVDGHRLRIPNLGSVRVHENTKRLRRLIARGGVPKSARFTRSANRWYVAITVSVATPAPSAPNRVQRAGGAAGVDLGVKALATLSDGTQVPNRGRGKAAGRKVTRLQRQAARMQGPDRRTGQRASRRWVHTQSKIARLQHEAALRRRSDVHALTKHLATRYALIGIEDLNVVGMTAAPAALPDPGCPGQYLANGAAAKSGLNRAILDVGFGEFARQLKYKSSWYGSQLVQVARYAPTSKTCSTCGTVKAKLSLAERTYRCHVCGLVIDRDVNAALNIRDLALTVTSPSPADVGDAKRPAGVAGPGAPELAAVDGREDRAPARPPGRATDPSPPQPTVARCPTE